MERAPGGRDTYQSRNLALRVARFVLSRAKSLLRRTTRGIVNTILQVLECSRLCILTLIDNGSPVPTLVGNATNRRTDSRRALILSLSPVFDDPRIRRQAVTLESRGWSVDLAGYEGRSAGSTNWNLIPLDKTRIRVRGKHKCLMPLSLLWSRFAETYYWQIPSNRYIWERLNDGAWNLVIANDYPTVPLAAAIAQVHDVDYVVDCHEYARAQVSIDGVKQRLRWILFHRAYVDAINRRFLPGARAVSTVCDGIADLLRDDYRMATRPVVIRSVPEYEAYPFRPCGETIRVLYHGAAVPSRGIEQAIDSVSLWRPEFQLCLRLVTTEAYLAFLKDRAARKGVGDRVNFLEPVPFTDMVRHAAEADIGYCVLENFSLQRRFTLPNKFFEYAMAGLAVVCSDLPELRKIGDRYGHCVFVEQYDPIAIAETINALTSQIINEMKHRALVTSRELCWENEQKVLINSYLHITDTATVKT